MPLGSIVPGADSLLGQPDNCADTLGWSTVGCRRGTALLQQADDKGGYCCPGKLVQWGHSPPLGCGWQCVQCGSAGATLPPLWACSRTASSPPHPGGRHEGGLRWSTVCLSAGWRPEPAEALSGGASGLHPRAPACTVAHTSATWDSPDHPWGVFRPECPGAVCCAAWGGVRAPAGWAGGVGVLGARRGRAFGMPWVTYHRECVWWGVELCKGRPSPHSAVQTPSLTLLTDKPRISIGLYFCHSSSIGPTAGVSVHGQNRRYLIELCLEMYIQGCIKFKF